MAELEQEDSIYLKKIMAQKENEWKKDKALYEQKIQLLEIQLEEYKNREVNQRKLNDTITQAFDISNYNKTQQKNYSEFQKSFEIQLQNNKKQQEIISNLEGQIRTLNQSVNDKENIIKDHEILQQKTQITYDHKIETLEMDKQHYILEIQRLKDSILKIEDNFKQKEQMFKLSCEQEIQKAKDMFFKDMQQKQLDYDDRYQQLAQLYEKEKEQLRERLVKCQNTIKKYQTHIESNAEVEQIQKKYEEQIQQLKQELHEQSLQYQYEKKMLSKQIDEQRNNVNFDSTSKKKSIDMVKFRNSIASQDSPVQCKSFHIPQPDFKQSMSQPKIPIVQVGKSQQQQQEFVQQKANQSYDKCKQTQHAVHDTLPMSIEDFNLLMSKKNKSQSTSSLPTNNVNLNSYIQEASICQAEQSQDLKEDYLKYKIQNQITTRFSNDEPRRSYSQQGVKYPTAQSNLSKMLGQTECSYHKQTTSISTQQKTHNTSFSHFKVPAFTQSQLNELKHSAIQQPCTTLRMNENHLNHIQSIKARYLNSEDDQTAIKYNKENQQPSKSVHINNEIKFLIGKLLQAKGRLTTELENTQKSFRYKN